MRIFKDIDLVEQLGSGIPRILETYGKECFEFSNNFLRMVFPSAEPVYAKEPKKLPKKGLVVGLVDNQQKIVRMIINKPKVSKKEMAEKIGISTTAIEKNIKILKEKKVIKRIGNNRSGYWKIVAKK